MRDAAIAGVGITLLPTFFIEHELKSGALVAIDIDLAAEGAEIFLAYPQARQPSAKLLALVAHLWSCFGDPPYWDGGGAIDRAGGAA